MLSELTIARVSDIWHLAMHATRARKNKKTRCVFRLEEVSKLSRIPLLLAVNLEFSKDGDGTIAKELNRPWSTRIKPILPHFKRNDTIERDETKDVEIVRNKVFLWKFGR